MLKPDSSPLLISTANTIPPAAFQPGLEHLEREVRAIIEAAGYDPTALVLEASLVPNQGWYFVALIATGIASRRQLAYHFGSADAFVTRLRAVMDAERRGRASGPGR